MLSSRNSAQKIGLVHGLKVIVRKKYVIQLYQYNTSRT